MLRSTGSHATIPLRGTATPRPVSKNGWVNSIRLRRSAVTVRAAAATSACPDATASRRSCTLPRSSTRYRRCSRSATCRQRSMLMPSQAPSVSFMAKGGATRVATTRSRLGCWHCRLCGGPRRNGSHAEPHEHNQDARKAAMAIDFGVQPAVPHKSGLRAIEYIPDAKVSGSVAAAAIHLAEIRGIAPYWASRQKCRTKLQIDRCPMPARRADRTRSPARVPRPKRARRLATREGIHAQLMFASDRRRSALRCC